VPEPILEISNLSKTYKGGVTALEGVDLTIERGEIFALLGPNGAGKTTLIGAVCGLVKPTSGTIKAFGKDVNRDWREVRRKIGLVPQELAFDMFDFVERSVGYSRGMFGYAPNPERIDEVLRSLALYDKRKARIRELSGGMKRRVMIAKALSHDPELLFLDEPTAGVDVELRQTLWGFIARLNRERGHTVLLTTHYLEEAEALCGRIAMLKAGRVVALDRTSNLLAGTAHQMLRFKTDDTLPADLAAQARVTGRIAQLAAHDAAEVEQLLARLRQSGVRIEDLEIGRPDLEDVFVEIMSGARD
jgi:ABC-2 type transport system ATP-binding protein